MKKLKFITAALTSVALLFGSFGITSCSDSGDDDSSKKPVLADVITNVSLANDVTFTAGDALPTSEKFVVVARISGKSKTLTAEEFTVTTPEANIDNTDTEALKLKMSGDAHNETVTLTIALADNPTVTKEFDIALSDGATVTKITATFDNAKIEYEVGDEFDWTGITVKGYYGEGDTTGEDITAKATCDFDSSSAAESVAVTFTFGEVSATEKLTVTIKEKSEEAPYELTFQRNNNSSTYAKGTYTCTLVEASSGEWQNQIFIKNPNADANLVAGDKVHASITVKADKAVESFYFKEQFNSGTYAGIDKAVALAAGESTKIDLYGTVTNDYDTSSGYVIDVRGNEANTTLEISGIAVEKLGDYEISAITLVPSASSVAAGENVTLKVVDQYGFEVNGANVLITSESSESKLEGTTLTAGSTNETVSLKATYNGIESAVVGITVTAEKDYNKYWNTTTTTGEKDAPVGYFSIWAAQAGWNCGNAVTLSNMNATETSATVTRQVESDGAEWFNTQIWYAVDSAAEFSFKVTSTVAGDITVNKTVYTLEANTEKEIKVSLTSAGNLAIQLGNESAKTILPEGTFTISNFSVTFSK